MEKFNYSIYKETRIYLVLYDAYIKQQGMSKEVLFEKLYINNSSYRRARDYEQNVVRQIVDQLSKHCQPYLSVVISNGTSTMFNNFSTALFSGGANYGISGIGTMEEKLNIAALTYMDITVSEFSGMKITETPNLYVVAAVSYYKQEAIDPDTNETIPEGSFIIIFSKVIINLNDHCNGNHIDLDNDGFCDNCGEYIGTESCNGNHTDIDKDGFCDNCSEYIGTESCNGNHTDIDMDGYCDDCDEYIGNGGNDPDYSVYIQLPEKFTITYSSGNEGETKKLVKDGDKLYWNVVSEYENRERLAIKQENGSYKIYEKDNKVAAGTWDMEYVPEYDNIYYALEGLDYSFVIEALNRINGTTPDGTGSATVAGMTCNIFHYVIGDYTYSYYVYSGLVFKIVEQYNAAITTFEVLQYLTTADLSGNQYQIN